MSGLRDSLDLIRMVRPEAGTTAIDHEIAAERASSLGAAEARVLKTLKALAGAAADREVALDDARDAVWSYFVQRELIGFRRHNDVIQELGIPKEVLVGLGGQTGAPVMTELGCGARAVVFDIDGVLVHGYHARPDLHESFDDKLRGLGINADRFQREFIHDIFMKRVLIGEVPMVEALDRRLKAFGYKGSTMTVLDLWMSHDCFPNAPMIETVRKLKADPEIRLFLATNQDHSRAQFLWHPLGLREIFEDMFYSARFGRTKAHKKFYEMAEERMPSTDMPPLFFDDTPKVVDAARKHGWEAVLFAKVEDCTSHPWIATRLGIPAAA